MAHLGTLCFQVPSILFGDWTDNWYSASNCHAITSETPILSWVVGHETNSLNPQILQNLPHTTDTLACPSTLHTFPHAS